jgi:hypothetical protein
MEDLCRNLLRKAACGFLVQGHIHNMSGPLQILSMQIELMRTFMERLPQGNSPEAQKIYDTLCQKLEQSASQVERLRSLLGAISEAMADLPTTLDLNELLKKELVFWEGDLVFKHEVNKDLQLAEGPLTFYAPPFAINQGLCALFWSFVPELSKAKGALRLTTEAHEEGPRATISLIGAEVSPENPFLDLAKELLEPYSSLAVKPSLIQLKFHKKGA